MNDFQPSLLLIGAGYLGKAIQLEFELCGWRVYPVTLHGGEGNLAADVSNLEDVQKLPTCDLMIHCASSGRGGAEAYQNVHVNGCTNLIRTFPQVPLIFTSSTSVYHHTDGEIVTESSPCEPSRETGRLLLEAERLVLANRGIVLRLAGIYGPQRSVILKKFLAGEATIDEDGARFTNQIHRDDAVAAILFLANHQGFSTGACFNVSDSTPLSQRQIYEHLCAAFALPFPPSVPRDVNRKRGWTHKQVSNSKLRQLGWEPRFPSFFDAMMSVSKSL